MYADLLPLVRRLLYQRESGKPDRHRLVMGVAGTTNDSTTVSGPVAGMAGGTKGGARQDSGRQTGWKLFIKKVTDRSTAVMGLGLVAPLLVPVALGVLISMGRPIFFVQTRPGRYGRPFKLIKFRTMRAAQDGEGLSADGQRLTGFGQFLRAFSLDELPQLVNVLKGEMSLVGPRPLLMQYLPRYNPEQARRHDVLPGMTGWAQVNGRNDTSWDERLRLDVEYVDNWNLLMDFRILMMTARRVISRKGVAKQGQATMPEFVGGQEEQREITRA